MSSPSTSGDTMAKMSASAERLLLIALTLALACNRPSAAPPASSTATKAIPSNPAPADDHTITPVPAPSEPASLDRIDVHVHLVADARDDLLAAMDRHGIAQAVVLASPHLDPSLPPSGTDEFAGWREANDRLLAQTQDHRDRLIPFITIDLAEVEATDLETWQQQGACGVKIYAGHQNFHQRPLDDPEHHEAFAAIERHGMPVLLHLNTVRFEPELAGLLAKYPKLSLLCAHLCGARTDLDRFERIMQAHPSVSFDTSHGPGQPGVEGFTNLERERERLLTLIQGSPERFLFGSDLVTMPTANNPSATRVEWDRQLAANLGLLEAERFEFFREKQPGVMTLGSYQGLALDGAAREAVLAGNAKRWLSTCLAARP
jgi:predicted TIM-barrel fold metal-dependent hydrolase